MTTEIQKQHLLKAFGQAFNRHDAQALIDMMTPDCTFRTAMGDSREGTVIRGRDAVKKAFEATFAAFPDAQWVSRGVDLVSGNRGFSEWTFVATRASDGARFDADGIDIFTFKDGLIHIKDAYRKDRPAIVSA